MRNHFAMATGRLLALRPLARNWSARRWSSFSQERAAEELHAKSTLTTWKRISLLVAAPIVGYLTWKLLIVGEEEQHEEGYHAWPHLRIRNKPFPWGDGNTSLFHNPHTNPGPDNGGEAEEEGKGRGFVAMVREAWLGVFEDPEERDKERWEHLARMQRRKEEYLAKKAAAIDKHIPLQPMNIFAEMHNTPVNPVDSEIDN